MSSSTKPRGRHGHQLAAIKLVALSVTVQLLLSPVLSRAAVVGGRKLAAVGAGRERRHAAARQPHGRGPLSGEAPLLALLLSLGDAPLRRRARGSGLRDDGRPGPLLGREPG